MYMHYTTLQILHYRLHESTSLDKAYIYRKNIFAGLDWIETSMMVSAQLAIAASNDNNFLEHRCQNHLKVVGRKLLPPKRAYTLTSHRVKTPLISLLMKRYLPRLGEEQYSDFVVLPKCPGCRAHLPSK